MNYNVILFGDFYLCKIKFKKNILIVLEITCRVCHKCFTLYYRYIIIHICTAYTSLVYCTKQ